MRKRRRQHTYKKIGAAAAAVTAVLAAFNFLNKEQAATISAAVATLAALYTPSFRE